MASSSSRSRRAASAVEVDRLDQGLPSVDRRGRGNQIVTVHVTVPEVLSPRQKEPPRGVSGMKSRRRPAGAAALKRLRASLVNLNSVQRHIDGSRVDGVRWTRTRPWAIEVASQNRRAASSALRVPPVASQAGWRRRSAAGVHQGGASGRAASGRGRDDRRLAREQRREGAVPVEAHRHAGSQRGRRTAFTCWKRSSAGGGTERGGGSSSWRRSWRRPPARREGRLQEFGQRQPPQQRHRIR